MPLVELNLDELIPPGIRTLLASVEAITEAVLSDLATAAQLKWRQLAVQGLSTSKADYLDSIQDIEVRTGERAITLAGWLANAIEQGLDSFDLKVTLLQKGAKRSKAGFRYRPIPFRHATPKATTGQVGVPMGVRYGPVSGGSLATPGPLGVGAAVAMGKALYQVAKRLKPGQRLPQGTAGAAPLAAHHATDLFAGMVKRTQKTPGGRPQTSGYMTFRMVSENPAIRNVADKWLHPGISARNYADQVADHIVPLVTPVFNLALDRALKRQ